MWGHILTWGLFVSILLGTLIYLNFSMQNSKKFLQTLGLLLFLALTLAVSDIIYFPISPERLDFVQRFAVRQINKSWGKYSEAMPKEKIKIVSYEDFLGQFNFLERRFVERVFAIDPKELGFKGPYFSKKPVQNLVLIPSKTFAMPDGPYETGTNYMPDYVHVDYEKMMAAMEKDLGRRLYIDSAYRSPGYQGAIFFYYLGEENNYSLRENAGWVAMPGYSEHGSGNTALDFINQDGISGEGKDQTAESFEQLPEYQWLMQNAAQYNFYLTYSRNNPYGVNYESWHWHWEKK